VKRRAAVALTILVLALPACGEGEKSPAGDKGGGLNVFPASYDLTDGVPARFLVGLSTQRNLGVIGGSVQLRFSFLGSGQAEGEPQFYREATAEFLPIPLGPEAPPGPVSAPASVGRGVYKVDDFEFDRAGLWEVKVTAELAEGTQSGTGAFEVLPEARVPLPGEAAPLSENLVAGDQPAEAVDSRAQGGVDIPDPELHATTIADAIAAQHPALVVFATPVYCVSKFCGPITDMVEGLEKRYGDRADFIHVEIWNNFQRQAINKAAADWLYREGGDELLEPWVFLIGSDGVIVERWDNVATEEEIEPLLQDLPKIE
jgi:hypothetical protein